LALGKQHVSTLVTLREGRHTARPMQRSRLGWYRRELTSLGLGDTIRFKLERMRGARPDVDVGAVFALRSRYAAHPLELRQNTSDLLVFHQIFVAREYRCLDDLADAGLVIDCGANVGYCTRISLLEIDIEGSELEVFSANVEPWIDRFARLVIELHDVACAAAVEHALRDQPLATSRCDELTVFQRLAA
jgi:hypothetical protein